MSSTEIVTDLLRSCLPVELDPYLSGEKFRRPAKSLEYVRSVDAGTQRLALVFDAAPRYDPRALGHLLPQMRFIFPELNQRVVDIVGDDVPSLVGSTRITFYQQLQNASPHDVRIGTPAWLVFDTSSAHACIGAIREFIKHWSIPFLNRYTTVKALTVGFEEQDERLPHDRRFWLFVIAAYTLLDQPGKAMRILEAKFGKPGLRRQHARVFEYVASELG